MNDPGATQEQSPTGTHTPGHVLGGPRGGPVVVSSCSAARARAWPSVGMGKDTNTRTRALMFLWRVHTPGRREVL